jgi:hypothetical protein
MICPNTNSEWAISGRYNYTDVGECPPYFDQIIKEKMDQGFNVFFCEIGRGPDYHVNYYKDILTIFKKVCFISFGSNVNPMIKDGFAQSYSDIEIDYVQTNFNIDEHFVTQFNSWCIEKPHMQNTSLIFFINMTQVDSVTELLNKMNTFSSNYYIDPRVDNYKTINTQVFMKDLRRLIRNKQKDLFMNRQKYLHTDYEHLYLKYKTKYLNLKKEFNL